MEFSSSTNRDELYSLALRFRDNKIEGLSVEQSISEAEKLFLQLADEGISKAMHNYASIQLKKENYELAYKYWSKSDLPASQKNCSELIDKRLISQDLYLVMGSERMLTSIVPPFVKEHQGILVKLTHDTTFGGKATTMDLNASQVTGAKHIVADASTFDFVKNKFNIKQLFCERLPTAAGDINDAMSYRTNNLTGKCIQNAAKSMQPGAKIDIEWEPFSSMVDMTREQLHESMTLNPFQGFQPSKTALQSIYHLYAGGEGAASEEVSEWAELQLSEFEYYVDHGMSGSIEELVARVFWEYTILIEMRKQPRGSPILIDFHPMRDSTEKFVSTAQSFLIHPSLRSQKDGTYVTIAHPTKPSSTVKGYVFHDPEAAVINKSLMNFMNNNIAVRTNTPYVVQFMQKAGFGEVTVERRINEHNGRQNVWMISAVKI
jgi:hypothetical protein